jgi:hypothetical protein
MREGETMSERCRWQVDTNVVAHPKSRTQAQKFVGRQDGQCAEEIGALSHRANEP